MEQDQGQQPDGQPAAAAVDPAGQATEAGGYATGTLAPAEAESPEGMPQLDTSTFDNQIFWLLVALAAIFVIVRRVVMPRLGSLLAAREDAVAGDLANAERLRDAAKAAQGAYDRALADARAEASRIAAQARAEVQAQLDVDLRAADARIAERATQSAETLRGIEAEASTAVAQVAREVARAALAALGGRPDDAALDAALAARTQR